MHKQPMSKEFGTPSQSPICDLLQLNRSAGLLEFGLDFFSFLLRGIFLHRRGCRLDKILGLL